MAAAGTLGSPGPITIGASAKVTVSNGTLQGNVVNNGNLDPLGRINVVGNYAQNTQGILVLDVAGTGPEQFGQLDISGTGVFNGPIDLDFINGFAPQVGDTFDFIRAAGGADFSGATVNILGLLPDFQQTDTFSNGTFILSADSNGVSTVPEPSRTWSYPKGTTPGASCLASSSPCRAS